jgi:hypothetical protein
MASHRRELAKANNEPGSVYPARWSAWTAQRQGFFD